MNESFTGERRRYERLPIEAPVVFDAGSFVGSGFLFNISRGGAGLEYHDSHKQLQVGAKIELFIKNNHINHSKNANVLDGEVCWIDEDVRRVGLSFIDDFQVDPEKEFVDFMQDGQKRVIDQNKNEVVGENNADFVKATNLLINSCEMIESISRNKDGLLIFSEHFQSILKKISGSFLVVNSHNEATDSLLLLSKQVNHGVKFLIQELLFFENIIKENSGKIDELENAILSFKLIIEAIFHDINNIITIIVGNAELIISDLEEGIEINKKNVIEIYDAGIRLFEIGRMAQKLCTNRFATEPTKVKKESIFSEMQFSRRDVDINNQVNFEMLPNSDLDSFMVYEDLLMNALMQIVQNARRYSSENGTIRIGFNEVQQKSQRFIKITIEDDGGGIAEENLSRIFEPKFTTKKGGRGGLGLSIAQNIIRSIGGDIQAENMVHENGLQGAKFTVFFPDTEANSNQLN